MNSALRAHREEEGFTLIELLVVVIIIGILAAIAIPAFLNQRERAWQSELTSTVRNVALEIEADATASGGDYTGLQAGFTGAAGGYLFDLQNAAADPVVVTATAADFTTTGFIICGRHLQIDGDDDGTTSEDDHHVTYNSATGGLDDFAAVPEDDCA